MAGKGLDLCPVSCSQALSCVKRYFWLSCPAVMTLTGQTPGPQYSHFQRPFAEGFPCSPGSANFHSLTEEGTSASHTQQALRARHFKHKLETDGEALVPLSPCVMCPVQSQEVEQREPFQGQGRTRVRG